GVLILREVVQSELVRSTLDAAKARDGAGGGVADAALGDFLAQDVVERGRFARLRGAEEADAITRPGQLIAHALRVLDNAVHIGPVEKVRKIPLREFAGLAHEDVKLLNELRRLRSGRIAEEGTFGKFEFGGLGHSGSSPLPSPKRGGAINSACGSC